MFAFCIRYLYRYVHFLCRMSNVEVPYALHVIHQVLCDVYIILSVIRWPQLQSSKTGVYVCRTSLSTRLYTTPHTRVEVGSVCVRVYRPCLRVSEEANKTCQRIYNRISKYWSSQRLVIHSSRMISSNYNPAPRLS